MINLSKNDNLLVWLNGQTNLLVDIVKLLIHQSIQQFSSLQKHVASDIAATNHWPWPDGLVGNVDTQALLANCYTADNQSLPVDSVSLQLLDVKHP